MKIAAAFCLLLLASCATTQVTFQTQPPPCVDVVRPRAALSEDTCFARGEDCYILREWPEERRVNVLTCSCECPEVDDAD